MTIQLAHKAVLARKNVADDPVDIFGDGSCFAAYTFDDTIAEYKGRYTNTAYNTPTYTTENLGKAINFNGTNQYAVLDLNAAGEDFYAISFWRYSNQASGYIETAEAIDSASVGFALAPDGSGFTGAFPNEKKAIGDSYSSTTLVSYQTWQHIVYNWDAGNSRYDLYVDGTLDDNYDLRENSSIVLANVSRYIVLGTSMTTYPTPVLYWPCKYDQLRVFNRVLTGGEITTLYNEGAL
jgi:hypothetical protein